MEMDPCYLHTKQNLTPEKGICSYFVKFYCTIDTVYAEYAGFVKNYFGYLSCAFVLPPWWHFEMSHTGIRPSMLSNSTKYGIKSWRYQAARLWNTIPNNLRNIDSYRSFKRGLKELDLASLWSLSQFHLVFLSILSII